MADSRLDFSVSSARRSLPGGSIAKEQAGILADKSVFRIHPPEVSTVRADLIS